jgi:hypothetical protein
LTLLVDWVENDEAGELSPQRGLRVDEEQDAECPFRRRRGLVQVGAFENVISRADWDGLPHRVERNSDAVLALFDRAGVKGHFLHARMGGAALSRLDPPDRRCRA